jgi:hypothetical protein
MGSNTPEPNRTRDGLPPLPIQMVTRPDGWTWHSERPDRLMHDDGRIRFLFGDGSTLELPSPAGRIFDAIAIRRAVTRRAKV